MKIIYHGHSCVELQLQNGLHLIFDPFITNNPQTDITVDYPVDFIFVSHGHAHHNGDMITLSKKNKAPIIAVPELTYYAEKESAITYPINLGGSANLPFGFVKMMHAQHSSSINVDGKLKYAGDAAGFLIKADNKTIFFAGDTSNFGDMAIFGKAFDIDVAFLPHRWSLHNGASGSSDLCHTSQLQICCTYSLQYFSRDSAKSRRLGDKITTRSRKNFNPRSEWNI